MIHRQPIIFYSLAGVLAGSIIAALILLTAKPTAPTFSSSQPSQTDLNSATPDRSTPTPLELRRHGQADQHFIVMMIPHHEDAVEMSKLALQRATHPELKTLASTIQTTQTREIEQMRTWYKQWYGTEVPAWQSGVHNSGMRHQGMMRMRSDLAALQSAKDFDRAFLEEMIPHHQMAVMMAQMLLSNPQHPELRDLATSVIKTQTDDINQMQQWYQSWYPTDAPMAGLR
ncbi:DUF305 domain-containing protein [Leptolyngbya sp. DQ-M1]|uniref:DUF305 domain-containing protein n=1 Tax=Leptolyngbya sp. DQ-M1 TaxID=2933920 RepID=UPI00329A0F88